jgi:hypothetical protein
VAMSDDGPPSVLQLEECSGRGPVFSIPVTIPEQFRYITWESFEYDGSSSCFVTSLNYIL